MNELTERRKKVQATSKKKYSNNREKALAQSKSNRALREARERSRKQSSKEKKLRVQIDKLRKQIPYINKEPYSRTPEGRRVQNYTNKQLEIKKRIHRLESELAQLIIPSARSHESRDEPINPDF